MKNTLFLLLVGCTAAVRADPIQSFKIVAVAGTHAPDGNGVFTRSGYGFGATSLNDAGQAAFCATLTGTVGGNSDNYGVFRGDGTALVQVARTGQTLPGGGGTISDLTESSCGGAAILTLPAINKYGQVVFSAGVTLNIATSFPRGIFRGEGTPASLVEIARGDHLTPDQELYALGNDTPSINDAGQVAFFTSTSATNQPSNAGIFRSDGNTTTILARSGLPAFGDTNKLFSFSAGSFCNQNVPFNQSGLVTFKTIYYFPSTQTLDTGGAEITADGNTMTQVARASEITPDGLGSLIGVNSWPVINNAGQTLFTASANGLIGTYTGLYRGSGTALTEIVRTGQAVPNYTNLTVSRITALNLNDGGKVCLQCDVNGGATPCIFRTDSSPTSMKLIVQRNQLTPDGTDNFNLFSDQTMNNAGQVAFQSPTYGGGGIFFYDDKLGLVQVIRTGDAFLGSTISDLAFHAGGGNNGLATRYLGRDHSGLNNLGQVAFTFLLADGREGIAIWTPPSLRATSIQRSGNNIQIGWNTIGGKTNVVQVSSSLNPASFSDLSGNIVVSGNGQFSTNYIHIDGATNSARYYRIRWK